MPDMDVVEELRESDIINIGLIQWNAPSPLGNGNRKDICIAKPVTDLGFTLNTIKDLGMQQPFDFDVKFSGVASTPNSDGTAQIQWVVSQTVNKNFKNVDIGAGFRATVHVIDVVGTMTALLSPQARQDGTTCGEGRSFGVTVATIPEETNKLIVHARALLSRVELALDQIVLNASAGRQITNPVVRIIVLSMPSCFLQSENVTYSFRSQTANLKAPLQYAWASDGNISEPNSDSTEVSFHTGTEQQQGHVALKVTDADGVSAEADMTLGLPIRSCD